MFLDTLMDNKLWEFRRFLMVFIDQISICIYVHCRHQVAKLFMVVWFFRRENAGSFIKRHLAINV